MVGPKEKEDDPTGEEPALEFDGTKTDQLDDTYRIRVASTSEGWNVESEGAGEAGSTAADAETFDLPRPVDDDAFDRSRKAPADVPTIIDKTDGYDPYDTIIESKPPQGFTTKARSTKPR